MPRPGASPTANHQTTRCRMLKAIKALRAVQGRTLAAGSNTVVTAKSPGDMSLSQRTRQRRTAQQ